MTAFTQTCRGLGSAWVGSALVIAALSGGLACSDSKITGSASAADGGVSADGSTADAGPVVAQSGLMLTMADGELEGDMAGTVRRFLKIPFAKPPLGELRWQAPVKNDAWKGVRHETKFSAACAQGMSQQGPASMNEDCLYLNVWTPEPAPQGAPVMVWFHGGGNFAGSEGDLLPNVPNAPVWYDGQFFAEKQGVVLVTVDYRLGAFGFFAHSELAAEHSPLGNQGLLDQQMSLQWVKKNIAVFGGDPNNVTIFGESAGSADVCYHVASPLSRGLFHRAISESGGCTVPLSGMGSDPTPASSKSGLDAFTKALGCDGASDVLGCLRKKTVQDILTTAGTTDVTAPISQMKNPWSFGVVVDGQGGVLPESPRALFDKGDINKVPYLLGSNNDEGTLFLVGVKAPTDDTSYQAALEARFPGASSKVLAQYPVSKFGGDYTAALARVVGDSGLVCGTHDTARRAAKAGLPVFMYNFDMPWAIAPSLLHVSHASEISHVFGNPYMPTADDDKVSTAMNTYWATFAQKGDPNYSSEPAKWPAFKPTATDDDQRLQFDAKFEIVSDFRKADCAFWRSLYPK